MIPDRVLEPDEQRLLELLLSNLYRAKETSVDCVVAAAAGKMPYRSALEKLASELRCSEAALTALIEREKGCPMPVKG